MKTPFVLPILALLFALPLSGRCDEPGLITKSGDTIAFLGDSITAQGAASPGGYVNLVINGLEQQGQKVTAIPAGISGHTSKDMLARIDRDVISKKPTWMTLSCGVNDVWHGIHGVELDPYKQNITAIVDKAQAAGIKVIMLTATMIQEDQKNAFNQKLVDYNDFLRSLAKDRKLPLADLNADMQAEIQAEVTKGAHAGGLLTKDGVHPNPMGHELMAAGILKAIGTSDAELAKIRQVWLDLPGAGDFVVPISAREFLELREMSADQRKPVEQAAATALSDALKAAPASSPAKP